ncbi:MAG: T9SS type A sorting domain-containing protein [Ignavibacteriae bacterium]|nr:T9SS type A sorting domain-containing protein [Ignavibacteriota bacterium]
MCRVSYFKFLLLLICGCGTIGFAQWSNDPNINAAIQITPDFKVNVVMTSDGAGGAIIAWEDHRGGEENGDIYTQRVNASGVVQWQSTGVPICVDTMPQYSPQIVSDGAGGAFIIWGDSRYSASGYDKIYTQRINGDGIIQWTVNGIRISSLDSMENFSSMISDDAGGAIIAWTENVPSIKAQRINRDGVRLWEPSGKIIASGQWRFSPVLVSDGNKGAIIAWEEFRSIESDIYAQHFDSAGIIQWGTDGIAICTAPSYQSKIQMVSNTMNGAILSWEDTRNGSEKDIYAQMVNDTGAVLWTTDGIAVCNETGIQQDQRIVENGLSGAVFVWSDKRNGVYSDLYAQFINSQGNEVWGTNGKLICAEGYGQENPSVIRDENNDFIFVWQDGRNGIDYNIFAQRMNQSGNTLWDSCGQVISSESHYQGKPKIINDGNHGAIIIWEDGRNDNFANDIYGYRIDLNVNGIADDGGTIVQQFALYQNYPNPFNPTTKFEYRIANFGLVSMKVFDALGREVSTLVNQELHPGTYSVMWDASGLPSGMYTYQLLAGEFQESKKLLLVK